MNNYLTNNTYYFTMTGGTITGNNTTGPGTDDADGGGVWSFGTFKVSGTPVIRDNVNNGTKNADGTYTSGIANNVYLGGNTITVMNDGMQSGAAIYITGTDGQSVITGTTSTTGFYCDTKGYEFVSDDNGGVKLASRFRVRR